MSTQKQNIRKLQVLYDNEINASISWFWDGGINWKLGDESNGIRDEGNTHTVDEAIEQIWSAALNYYLHNNDEARVKLLKDLYE